MPGGTAMLLLLAPLFGCEVHLVADLTGDTAAESICPPLDDPPIGGYADVAVTDPDVEAAAAFAVEAITGSADTPYEILCAQEQTVAGTNYRMGLAIDGVDHLVVVFEDLDGEHALTSDQVVP